MGKIDLAKIKRILIICSGGIGNVILFTPVLKSLKKHLSKTEIVLLTAEPGVEKVIDGSGLVDEIIFCNRQSIYEKFQFIRSMREKAFDLAIVASGINAFKASLLAYLMKIPYRVGENINGLGLWYTTKVDYQESLYEMEGNLNLIRAIGITSVDEKPFICICEADEKFAEEFFAQNDLLHKLIIGMHIGPAAPAKYFKRWPDKNFLELARRLTDTYQAKIILIGGQEELALSKELAKLMIGEPAIAVGKTSIGQSAALIKRCNLFISSDSGPMHIAGAVGTPIIAIFGPTDPKKTHPCGNDFMIARKDLACSPCYRRGRIKCKPIHCLNSLSVEEVLQLVERRLRRDA